MKAIRVFLVGSSGRMGQEVKRVILKGKSFKLAGESDERTPLPEFSTGAQVVVDFSAPSGFSSLLKWCVKHKLPLVSGTTGLRASDHKAIERARKQIAVLWAPNMSLGIALFKKLMACCGELKDFDFQIEEFHHRHKKDRPSGTALLLQDELKKYTKNPSPPVSLRLGGLYGTHRLHMVSEEEHLIIEHTALTRAVFAKGALAAAEWLVKKGPGSYEMGDVLGG